MLYPAEITRQDGLMLSKSALTGNSIINGFNQKQPLSQKYGKNVTRTMVTKAEAKSKGGRKGGVKMEILDDKFHPVFENTLTSIDKNFMSLMTPEQSLLKKKLCKSCQTKGNCPDCRLDVEARTVEESTEERLLAEGISFNEDKKRFEVNCVYKSLIDSLPTYKNETLTMMKKMVEKIEKSENSENIAKDLDGAIEKNLQKSVFLWEAGWLKEGKGRENLQQSYSPCSWACKREGTTLTRLCHNLSFSRGDHPSLNDCQLTGHSNNFKISFILLLHRGYKYYSTADVSKFYNCVDVGPRDASLQRFLWPMTKDGRPSILSKDPDTTWQSIIPQTLLFGARHAQCLARLSLMKASEMFLSHRPDLQWFLVRSYTDDLAIGSNKSKEEMKLDQQVITEALKEASESLLKKKLCKSCQTKGNCPDCRLDVEARTVEESTSGRRNLF